MKHNPQLTEFYDGGSLELTSYHLENDNVIAELFKVTTSPEMFTLPWSAVVAALSEIDTTTGVYRQGTFRYEMGYANASCPETDFEPFTYRTSAAGKRGNPGVAVEVAIAAALDQNRRRQFATLPGNGGSSGFTAQEKRYIAPTGRWTVDNPSEALPTVQALAMTLETESDSKVTRIITKSGGGRLGIAVAERLPFGQVTDVFLQNVPGWCDVPWSRLISGMFGKEHLWNSVLHAAQSTDPWCITNETKQQARDSMQHVYGSKILSDDYTQNLGVARGRNLVTAARSFKKAEKYGDPLAEDVRKLIIRQPGARVGFLIAEEDALLTDKDVRPRIRRFLGKITIEGAPPPYVYALPGMAHAFHTRFPMVLEAIQRRVLNHEK